MAKGDQYGCEWCTFSWKTKSDTIPIRCPSCEDGNIINEVESFRKILGEENILQVDKKIKKKPKFIEEEVEEKGFFSRLFNKK
jgi:hypothetical protein